MGMESKCWQSAPLLVIPIVRLIIGASLPLDINSLLSLAISEVAFLPPTIMTLNFPILMEKAVVNVSIVMKLEKGQSRGPRRSHNINASLIKNQRTFRIIMHSLLVVLRNWII